MSSKKEEKSQAAALSAAKGLSRAQAERAAAAAARNVNAYGLKEEGPSRWQEKREAKRQMYLMSTERAVRLGERKDIKSTVSTIGGTASQCQKCFQTGHWTVECKNERVYMSRPSRTQQLKNPKLKMKVSISYDLDDQDVNNENAEMGSKKAKKRHWSHSDPGSDSEASVFETDSGSSETRSDYSSPESSSAYSSSPDSEEERRQQRRKKKKLRKEWHGSYSSYSESSDSGSESESDTDDRSSRRKSRKHNRKSESDSDDRSRRRKSRKHNRKH